MNLKRALEIIDGGARIPHIRFITADVKKGKGGKVIELLNCRLARSSSPSPVGEGRGEACASDTDTIRRNPNHHLHFTRNLLLPNNQVRKVHPLLITHLNQEEVI